MPKEADIANSTRPGKEAKSPQRNLQNKGGDRSHRHMGGGAQGKGSGSGATTETAGGGIGENDVLSNRDKAQHSKERGLDSKRVQTDQLRDTTANRGRE